MRIAARGGLDRISARNPRSRAWSCEKGQSPHRNIFVAASTSTPSATNVRASASPPSSSNILRTRFLRIERVGDFRDERVEITRDGEFDEPRRKIGFNAKFELWREHRRTAGGQQDRRPFDAVRGEKQRLGIDFHILAIEQGAGERAVVARDLQHRAQRAGIDMRVSIGGQRDHHLRFAALGERGDGFARQIGTARNRRSNVHRAVLGVGEKFGERRFLREFEGDARASPAAIEEPRDQRRRSFGMAAELLGDIRDALPIGDVDKVAGKPLELTQIPRPVSRAFDELRDDRRQKFADGGLPLVSSSSHELKHSVTLPTGISVL